MREKQLPPAQNMQRVKAELRDKDPSVNVVMRNGLATRGTGEKVEIEPLIHKAVSKQEGLDLDKEREIFIAARRDFIETEASTSLLPTNLKVDEEVKPFLQACMKLLHNPKAMQNL